MAWYAVHIPNIFLIYDDIEEIWQKVTLIFNFGIFFAGNNYKLYINFGILLFFLNIYILLFISWKSNFVEYQEQNESRRIDHRLRTKKDFGKDMEEKLWGEGSNVFSFQRSVSMLDATMRAGCASTRANRNVYTPRSRSNNAGWRITRHRCIMQ